jgi:RNA polymerase sigma-70 factor, ECF subfamily
MTRMSASALDETYAAARAAWPGVDVARDQFGAYVTERAGDQVPAHATDLYLACAAAAGDPRGLSALDRVLGEEVAAAGAAVGADRASVDEAAQIVRTLLLLPRAERPPALLDFAGRGPLRGWLRITATRELIRLARRGHREVELEEHVMEAPAIAGDDPALAAAKLRYREALAAAFRDALAALSAKDRVLLRFQLADGLSIDDIAAIHNVHRATAARWLVRIREELVERTHQILAERLVLEREDVASIVRLVQSQLEVSVLGHLKA